MPAWEDTANKNGGKWAIQVPRDKTKGAIDKMWLYTVCTAE
jgi:translation initiation factor 4E